MSKTNFEVQMIETLESSGGMKLIMKFYLLLHNFAELWNLFPRVSMENCFWYYFKQLFISLTFEKCKKVFNILKRYSVTGFCPLETEID